MYFRFGSALVLVFLMSVGGIAIEKQCLSLRRAVIRQQYRRRDTRRRIRASAARDPATRRPDSSFRDD